MTIALPRTRNYLVRSIKFLETVLKGQVQTKLTETISIDHTKFDLNVTNLSPAVARIIWHISPVSKIMNIHPAYSISSLLGKKEAIFFSYSSLLHDGNSKKRESSSRQGR